MRYMVIALGIVLVSGLAAQAQWTAYNDNCFDPNQIEVRNDPNGVLVHYTSPNVTNYAIAASGYANSGELVKKSDGTGTGVTATVTESGGMHWQPDTSDNWYGGYDPVAGTDAKNTFGGIVDMTGVTYYASAGWWVDVELSGLDPNKTYNFATSAARSKPTYSDRISIFTLNGADSFTNSSTPGTDNELETYTTGTDILGPNQVRFITGDNNTLGYVARWTDIDPGDDGTITIRTTHDAASNGGYKAYAPDVFMVQEVGVIPEPSTIAMLVMGLFGLLAHAWRKRS